MAKDVSEDFKENEMPEKEVVLTLLKKGKELEQKNAEGRANFKTDCDIARDQGVNMKAFKMFKSVMKVESQEDRDSIMAHLVHYFNEWGQDAQLDMFREPMGHNSQNGANA